MAGGVGFLSLAYLVEISVVLNLAYRELKFPELHKRLQLAIDSIEEHAKTREIVDSSSAGYDELQKLKSLLGNDAGRDLWRDVKDIKFFFNSFIKSRQSLSIANYSILLNVGFIILFSLFSGIKIASNFCDPISMWRRLPTADFGACYLLVTFQRAFELGVGSFVVFCVVLTRISNWTLLRHIIGWSRFFFANTLLIFGAHHFEIGVFSYSSVWHLSLGMLISLTVLPLLFIKMATRCEAFLFGDEEKAGVVNELKAEMLRQKDLQEQTLNKAAEAFQASKSPN